MSTPTQPFQGETMACRLCAATHRSDPEVESGWTLIELDGRGYYVCPTHFPDGLATTRAWSRAYQRVLKGLLRVDATTPSKETV